MEQFIHITQLYTINQPNGYEKAEIEIIKNLFGEIPQLLADYYAKLGKYSFNQAQDSLLTPDNILNVTNPDYLIFYIENQGCCFWAINKNDLSNPDPPVYMSGNKINWEIESPTLSQFLYAMACLQATFALEYTPECFREVTPGDIQFIRHNFQKRDISFQQWIGGIEFYGNRPDTVITYMPASDCIAYASGSKEHFEEMNNMLSGIGTPM
ncbi:hypothetical protein [Bacteroides sp. 519]|uniref:hypothetical protein n=1 Tax=Bacteroides sp. 519 TaxID=2302937 RepID=UPI0013D2B491|nr:hypothetical protein [Bacteroides sp. 519]NDV56532.1 hypothetical protein [Bacteroides sp. 519]